MFNVILNYIRKSPHRNYLEKYLRVYLPKLEGRILDIGSKNRRYDLLLKNKPVAIDITENVSKDVLQGDVNNLAFDDNSFDSIICLEVLEYIDTPEKAFLEMSRVLRSGGTLILSVPFMYREHDDMLRYTKKYLVTHLGRTFSSVECYLVGNAYSIILDTIKDKINKVKFRLFRYLLLIVYLPFVLILELFPAVKESRYVSGYFIVAKK